MQSNADRPVTSVMVPTCIVHAFAAWLDERDHHLSPLPAMEGDTCPVYEIGYGRQQE